MKIRLRRTEQSALTRLSPSGSRAAALSALIPGLGQWAQGRWWTGGAHMVTVLSYLGTAGVLGGPRWLLAAFCWNVWSAVDAYREGDADANNAPGPPSDPA